MNLQKEINLNKKFILILVLVNIIALGLYYSYALFQVKVIKDNVIVINTGTINLTVTTGETNNTFTVAAGETKTINVSLTTTNQSEIGYKLYYTASNSNALTITSPKDFQDNIVKGTFTTSDTFTLKFKNTGLSSVTITLGGIGGLAAYPITLESGQNEITLSPLPANEKVLARANSVPNCTRTVTDTDGIIYISGKSDNPNIYANAQTDDCVIDFNYVWWSGKMWRITAIYPDGAIKMITDNNITTIAFNASNQVNYYTKADPENEIAEAKSYMFQWLNEDFLDTLYNHGADVIDTTKYWNATMPADTTISTKPTEAEATMIPTTTSPIGLLNSYEYWMSYKNLVEYNSSSAYGSGYLNIGYYWWLLNPYSVSRVRVVGSNGNGSNFASNKSYASRPSIIIKSKISMTGNGTKENPYLLPYDYDSANTSDKIFTRNSGEYIKFMSDGDNAPLYRIVGVEGDGDTKITKIVAMDYATYDNSGTPAYTKFFASTVTFGADGNTKSNNYWDYYLNNDWYDNLSFKSNISSGTFYIGTVATGENYKLSICKAVSTDTTSICLNDSAKRVTTTFVGNIGLLRYGEMFATRQSPGDISNVTYMWLISKVSTSWVWRVDKDGIGSGTFSDWEGIRPSLYLKSSVAIQSGNGTELDPYIVS